MKNDFAIRTISKDEAKSLLEDYHYLSKIQRGFKSKFNYGLFKDDTLVGVCIFTGLPVKELLKGMMGGDFTDNQDGYYELSRLVIHPETQQSEHNIASWFVSRCINLIRKTTDVKLILSYADDDYHKGTVYRALGFKYYGLTDSKKDFWFKLDDGTYKKHSRGKVKGFEGEWRPRSRKHRFLLVYDKTIDVRWTIPPL